MFTTLMRVDDGRRIKILTRCNREQVYRYTVQVVELYKYKGLPVDNFVKSFRTLEEAQSYFEVCFADLTTGARIEKAEAILRRIRGKIYAFDNSSNDFVPRCWIKAERKIRRWLGRNIPQKAVERRDVLDVYYL
jgi:hypothetical protein|uniref:Uncharacterized protein n=1 Tax=Podoviridae sp. ctUS21 TaxID=2826557 RepID=A0A8S5MQ76_9CAUD|nr:MAG TPA: hypothetical protein [Podoviridae sp. ctUS21]